MKGNTLFSKTTFRYVGRRLKVYLVPITILVLIFSISIVNAGDKHVLTSEGPPNSRPTK